MGDESPLNAVRTLFSTGAAKQLRSAALFGVRVITSEVYHHKISSMMAVFLNVCAGMRCA